MSIRGICLSIVITVPLKASADPPLASPAQSQKQAAAAVAIHNRLGAQDSRAAARNSVLRGVRHIRHGRLIHFRPEVVLGYFQVIQGVLGYAAARKAERLADKSAMNAAGLGAVPETATLPVSESPSEASARSGHRELNGTGSSLLSTDRTAVLRQVPELKEALQALHEDHEISREEFWREVEAGRDGRELIAAAPKAPPDAGLILEAWEKARAELAVTLAATASSPIASVPAAPSERDSAKAPAPEPPGHLGLRRELVRKLASVGEPPEDQLELSEEVREALARKEKQLEQEALRERLAEADLFEVVHFKYQEREAFLRWGDPVRSSAPPERN